MMQKKQLKKRDQQLPKIHLRLQEEKEDHIKKRN
jgi:hypothetical protein